jgi:hypothetical protein
MLSCGCATGSHPIDPSRIQGDIGVACPT